MRKKEKKRAGGKKKKKKKKIAERCGPIDVIKRVRIPPLEFSPSRYIKCIERRKKKGKGGGKGGRYRLGENSSPSHTTRFITSMGQRGSIAGVRHLCLFSAFFLMVGAVREEGGKEGEALWESIRL